MKGGQTFPITNISYEDTNKYIYKADEGINIKKKIQIPIQMDSIRCVDCGYCGHG